MQGAKIHKAVHMAGALQGLKLVGPQLELRREDDCWRLLLTAVQAYRLLGQMSANVADLLGRLSLYETIDRGDGR